MYAFWSFADIWLRMAPKEGSRRPSKRAVPEAVTDVGSAHGTAEEDFQIEQDREIEWLRLEIRRLRAEGAGGRPQSSSANLPVAPVAEQRVAARERIEEGKVSLKEFLRYDTPKFWGEDGKDLQGFLRKTKKVMKIPR